MEATLDYEEEARAAEELARQLEKVEAPKKLIDQARQQAVELRQKASKPDDGS